MPKIALPKKVIVLNKQLLSKIICSIKPLEQWMAATAPFKKSPSMTKWMAQADSPKKASTVKK